MLNLKKRNQLFSQNYVIIKRIHFSLNELDRESAISIENECIPAQYGSSNEVFPWEVPGSFRKSCQYVFWPSHRPRHYFFSLQMMARKYHLLHQAVQTNLFQSRSISFPANSSRLKMCAAVRRGPFLVFACVRWGNAERTQWAVDLNTFKPHFAVTSHTDLIAFAARFTMRRSLRAETWNVHFVFRLNFLSFSWM